MLLFVVDDHPDRAAENGPAPASGARRPQNRPLLGVRCGGASAAGGNFCADCPLARMHLVRDRERRALHAGTQDRVAGCSG